MATSEAVEAFFSNASSLGDIVVRDLPKIEINAFIQNYKGHLLFDRLLLIGTKCVPLCVDVLKAAVNEAKAGVNVSRYRKAWDCIRRIAPEEPEALRDDVWISKTEAFNAAETLRIETELKGYKNNLIKESIRLGNEELGLHYQRIGKFQEASDTLSRTRQDASTTRHISACTILLARLSLYRRDWATVLTHIGKISGLPALEPDRASQAESKIITGIAHLGKGDFEEAARYFLKAEPAFDVADLASPNDIAVYGGLTALATMDRQDLQQQALDNLSFRTFMEQEPFVRKAISLFVNGRYTNCLSVLESMRPDLLLDIFLQQQVTALFSKIRNKCIVQYLQPFSYATIEDLQAAFGQPNKAIVTEVISMIREGALKARIDVKDGVLVMHRADLRAKMQVEVLDTVAKFEEDAKEHLRRISLKAAGLEVSGNK